MALPTSNPRAGSSPLTRGKQIEYSLDPTALGLIPAHAGKTSRRADRAGQSRAHPRSRGENELARVFGNGFKGSSPLTRGKQEVAQLGFAVVRLIPAHAGKTRFWRARGFGRGAHPRSRGENRSSSDPILGGYGSSPLTRGKLSQVLAGHPNDRLIPAHAGKTLGPRCEARASWAHPRSRGENERLVLVLGRVGGSSPLTRGKRARAPRLR